MDRIKVAKELIKLAKNIIALDEQGDGSGFQYYHDQENNEQEMLDLAQKQGKKYILHHKEGKLWRIQACKDFGDVKKGKFGGLIESEKNLSQEGNCWIYDGAKVHGNAKVFDDAKIYDNSSCGDNAQVYGNAQVFGHATVWNNAQVYDNAQVYGWARVHDDAKVYGWAEIKGGQICDNGQVYDMAIVSSGSYVGDRGKVHGHAIIKGKVVQREEITE